MDIVDRLRHDGNLPDEEFIELLQSEEHDAKLFSTADEVRKSFYGKDVYLRGLIEFTNCCKNNCYYCGIRKDNSKAQRYRMDRSEILSSCNKGYELGFRTFVLQGGEDPFFTDEKICGIVSEIKRRYPDCAVTLSIGEKSRESYRSFFDAGASRYLLRHEAASGSVAHQGQKAAADRRLDCPRYAAARYHTVPLPERREGSAHPSGLSAADLRM